MALGWSISLVAFKRVASMVELTYVAPNIVTEEKSASRMLTDKLINVKDEIVEKDKLLPVGDAAFEFFPRHRSFV